MTLPAPARVLYVAGPMTGIPGYNLPAFDAATRQLTDAGYRVINPGRHGVDPHKTWTEYVRRGLAELVTMCDAVALLDGYSQSRGAQLEITVARALTMPVHPLRTWLATAPTQDPAR